MVYKILVAFATKYGSTAEIAGKIGGVFEREGLSIDVLPAGRVRNLNLYRAVVLGSAVYMGRWRKEAAGLLRDNEKVLTGLPVWLFSSGPTGAGDPVELMKGWRFPRMLQPVANRIGPRSIALFNGALDVNKLNLLERWMIKNVRAPVGDFRDWDAITSWAVAANADLKKTM